MKLYFRYILLISVLFGGIGSRSSLLAQYSLGNSGLLNIPTATPGEAGHIMVGANFLPREIMPNSMNYNSGNYFATVNFFSFLELTFRETLLKSEYVKGSRKFNQDRSIAIKLAPLKEGKYHPSIAFGTNDPFSTVNSNYLECYYLVATKGVELGGSRLEATAGYFYAPTKKKGTKSEKKAPYDGPFGGMSLRPAFYRNLQVIAEYDSKGVNVGAAVKLWNHLSLDVFTREFKCVSAGIRFEYVLLH